jgi:hypothetical protein
MTKRAIPLLFALAAALAAALATAVARGDDSLGTVVFDVKPLTSQVELEQKVRDQLEAGGIRWGAQDGQLVVSMVDNRFLHFDLPYMTGYGNQRQIELPPGTYHLSCVGYIAAGGFSVEKALRKGAYFNLDVLTFQVAAGETTLLEVAPVVRAHAQAFVKYPLPELRVKVTEDGVAGDEAVINERTGTSVPWDNYEGSLKF